MSSEAANGDAPKPPQECPQRSPPHSGEGAASAMNELRKRRPPEQPASNKLRRSQR
jgi:hypothetical protein